MWRVNASNCYRVLNRELSSWYKQHSFRKLPHVTCGWFVDVDSKYFVMIFSHLKGGGDEYIGSKFRVDVCLGDTPKRDYFSSRNIADYLDDDQLAELVHIQSSVIASLRKPDENHPWFHELQRDTWFAKIYLSYYKPIVEPYNDTYNVFFEYLREVDVVNWAGFIAKVLPSVMERIRYEKSDNE